MCARIRVSRRKLWSSLPALCLAFYCVLSWTSDGSSSDVHPAPLSSTALLTLAPNRLQKARSKSAPELSVSIKTTVSLHSARLPLVFDTWFIQNESIYFFTDGEDSWTRTQLGKGHFVNTGCGKTHHRDDLCCKTQAILSHHQQLLQKERVSRQSWLCLADDDNYVNLDVLKKLLDSYENHSTPMYIGRPSTAAKVDLLPFQKEFLRTKGAKDYWFATGGAVVCLNQPAFDEVLGFLADHWKTFRDCCHALGVPDDMTLGLLLLARGVLLTQTKIFNSHIHFSLLHASRDILAKQATLSYGGFGSYNKISSTNGTCFSHARKILLNSDLFIVFFTRT